MKNIIECKRMALNETGFLMGIIAKTRSCKIIDLSLCDDIWVVIIHNNPETINHWVNNGYIVDYDMLYFTNETEYKRFINGKHAYDFIDNCYSIGNDKIVCCMHNGKIIA